MIEKKTHFIITRVTASEKEYLKKQAEIAKKKFSNFVRQKLGLVNIPPIL